MSVPSVLLQPYSDNDSVSVAERLAAEIENDPSRLDVATGYFEPSAWAAVGEAVSKVGSFRLLLGKDHELDNLSPGGESANIEALVRASIATDTQPEGLITRDNAVAVAELIAFLEAQHAEGNEVVKLWRGEGFLHAKAYILAGSMGIGSANFTYSGMQRNRELVGWRQDYAEVDQVRKWFEGYWEHPETSDYTDELIRALRETPLVSDQYTPYDVLIRTLAARYGTESPASLEQASFTLKWFQEDAVIRLVKLLNGPARGALLADAVGLGKTFCALGVIHHYLYTQAERRKGSRGRPVLIIAPAALEGMWRTELEKAGLDWACELLTTQRLRSGFDPRPYAGADLVVIDEAHRLRGGRTWFREAIELLTRAERADERRVLLLTATPINTAIDDLTNLLRVMAKNSRSVWAPEIADFEAFLKRVEKRGIDPFPLLDRALVRRSRTDILEAQHEARAAGSRVEEVQLPDRRTVHIDYSYGEGSPELFDSFAAGLRSLALAPYDLDRFRDEDGDPAADESLPLLDETGAEIGEREEFAVRPGTLAALAAAGLLTRFQSSLRAIRRSLVRLDGVLARFLQSVEMEPPRLLQLSTSAEVQRLIRDELDAGDRDEAEGDDEGEGTDDELLDSEWAEALERAPVIEDAESLDIAAIREAVRHDRELIAELLSALPYEDGDGKLAALVDALGRPGSEAKKGKPGLAERKVLIFTQYRDTARYLEEVLGDDVRAPHVGQIARIDGAVSAQERRRITAFFDPDREGAAATEQQLTGADATEEAVRVLISTDVLAEGHNLQLASAVVNFDLHFNPQVAVQRAGRIDRLNSPHRSVALVSMLPPEDLDRHIGLEARLDERFRRIHGLGLGDERTTPIASDVQGSTLEQMRRLYADDATVLDEIERTWTFGSTDYMRSHLSAFLQSAGLERLGQIPVGVSSVKRLPRDWSAGPGVFLALAAPAPGGRERETYWRFYPNADGGYDDALKDDVTIFRAIACRREEPRADLAEVPAGPGVFDWDLIGRAAEELAEELTLVRSQAELSRGASERSRRVRTEIRANATGLEIPDLELLGERLLQVRVEDYDASPGWRRFDDARRALKRAEAEGERRDAALALAESGLELFGEPEEEPDDQEFEQVRPDSIRLIAYEVLVSSAAKPSDQGQQGALAVGQD
jgi:superfamily II DNA or RNA helicase